MHDGLAAVEAAEHLRPDVVLLDVGLPKLSGIDACRRIRSHAWGKGMVIVALTGWGQEHDRRNTQGSRIRRASREAGGLRRPASASGCAASPLVDRFSLVSTAQLLHSSAALTTSIAIPARPRCQYRAPPCAFDRWISPRATPWIIAAVFVRDGGAPGAVREPLHRQHRLLGPVGLPAGAVRRCGRMDAVPMATRAATSGSRQSDHRRALSRNGVERQG